MQVKFNVTGKERKELVKGIERIRKNIRLEVEWSLSLWMTSGHLLLVQKEQ